MKRMGDKRFDDGNERKRRQKRIVSMRNENEKHTRKTRRAEKIPKDWISNWKLSRAMCVQSVITTLQNTFDAHLYVVIVAT